MHFLVGLMKAPFGAVIIGMIGCFQGMRVEGNAGSPGRLSSRSVVQAVLMVIVADATARLDTAMTNFAKITDSLSTTADQSSRLRVRLESIASIADAARVTAIRALDTMDRFAETALPQGSDTTTKAKRLFEWLTQLVARIDRDPARFFLDNRTPGAQLTRRFPATLLSALMPVGCRVLSAVSDATEPLEAFTPPPVRPAFAGSATGHLVVPVVASVVAAAVVAAAQRGLPAGQPRQSGASA